MGKHFNTEGNCSPNQHYMVDLTERLEEIKKLIDQQKYFTIHKARQYGKTTILKQLEHFLQEQYLVIRLDFQGFSHNDFASEESFSNVFLRKLLHKCNDFPQDLHFSLEKLMQAKQTSLSTLFDVFSEWCAKSPKPIVLLIDEVDHSSNHEIFLDFLSQLRLHYIEKDTTPTFQSVILASVYDIRNLKSKLQPELPHRSNSPWNIASDFEVELSFSSTEITQMLSEYDKDKHSNMNIQELSQLIYDYTLGYPFLVSRICKLLDEKVSKSEAFYEKSPWSKEGFLMAIKLLLYENNTLFASLISKLYDFTEIHSLVRMLLFSGKSIPYNARNSAIEIAEMFGFVKRIDSYVVIANRIFETLLYDQFLSDELITNQLYTSALRDQNQFIQNGHLNIELVLEKFIQHFTDLYGNQTSSFVEEEGRKYFLLFLKPIINGVGNYYIEAQTRNLRRTDVIIDYLGEQFIIEMKIWHGNEYHSRGEQQLWEYLDYYHLEKGYLLSFNFNKNKQIGINHITVNGKELIEAVV